MNQYYKNRETFRTSGTSREEHKTKEGLGDRAPRFMCTRKGFSEQYRVHQHSHGIPHCVSRCLGFLSLFGKKEGFSSLNTIIYFSRALQPTEFKIKPLKRQQLPRVSDYVLIIEINEDFRHKLKGVCGFWDPYRYFSKQKREKRSKKRLKIGVGQVS